MSVTIPSLPRRQANWRAISAGIVPVGYACIAGVVFVLRGAVGFFVPGIDYPHPTLDQQISVLVAGTTSLIGPRVGRVETDEPRPTVFARSRSASGLIAAPHRERPFQPLDRSEDLVLLVAGVAQHEAAGTGRGTLVEGGEGQGLDAEAQRRFRRPPVVAQGVAFRSFPAAVPAGEPGEQVQPGRADKVRDVTTEKKETNVQQRDALQERNLALMRRFCEARANGDREGIMGCLTEDVVWRYPGRNPLSREYRGKEDVASFFRRLRELTGGDFSSETERIMVDGDAAFVHELPCGTRKGKSLEWRTVLMFRLRGGRIAEVDVFQNVQHELDEWWNS